MRQSDLQELDHEVVRYIRIREWGRNVNIRNYLWGRVTCTRDKL